MVLKECTHEHLPRFTFLTLLACLIFVLRLLSFVVLVLSSRHEDAFHEVKSATCVYVCAWLTSLGTLDPNYKFVRVVFELNILLDIIYVIITMP